MIGKLANLVNNEDNQNVNINNVELILDEYDDELSNYIFDSTRARFYDLAKLNKELINCQNSIKNINQLIIGK